MTLERSGETLIFKEVKAEVCENCGEAYLGEATTAHLLQAAEEATRQGVQVEVRILMNGAPVTPAVA